jgi:hypothetical protein
MNMDADYKDFEWNEVVKYKGIPFRFPVVSALNGEVVWCGNFLSGGLR